MAAFKIYWDTNAFIQLVENDDQLSYRLAALRLRAFDDNGVSIHTSELTLAELLVAPVRENDTELADVYRGLLRSHAALNIHAVDRECLELAARIRAHRDSIKLPDAIHVAAARIAKCSHFVTGDRRLASQAGISWVALTVPSIEALSEAIDD